MKKVLLVNGPNINMLGTREQSIYGSTTYEELMNGMTEEAASLGIELEVYQSNHEGELVDKIQSARDDAKIILINAGAYTHTSVAVRDALLAVDIPVIEVHISNIYKREEFRHHSYISDIATGVIAGLGTNSYRLAIHAAADMLKG